MQTATAKIRTTTVAMARAARTLRALAALGALAVTPALAEEATGTAGDFAGRWNFTIAGQTDTFAAGWLEVASEAGQLGGALVWKWGSVVKISDAAVEGGELRFARGKERFRARLEKGELHGVATGDGGAETRFVGRRATEMCDVSGRWQVGIEGKPDDPRATLVFAVREGTITGRAVDPDGVSYAVDDAKLDGKVLSFRAVSAGDGLARVVRCEIRGDVLAGHVSFVPPGETEERTFPIEGRREREWGTPVTLIAKDDLAGWKARDTAKKFGWQVAGGILENSPPDVDIMSEAKFRDFRLQLEYKVEPGSNSGIYLRGRYELQILGKTEREDHGNMAVYSRLKPGKNPIRLGDWNALEVTLIGRWLTVVLNGETIYENEYLAGPTGGAWDPYEEEPGPLLLQGDHGKVWFRKITVTPVK